MAWKDHIASIMLFTGVFGGIGTLIWGFSNMTYEETRPWAGPVTRTFKGKDGIRREQTYWSKGQAASKGTFPPLFNPIMTVCSLLIFGALFV
jgi:hypothetical protein